MSSFQINEQVELTSRTLRGSIRSGVKQLCKGQDFVIDGKTDTYLWKVVCDGHGSDFCINIIRGLDWDDIMDKPNSFDVLLNQIRFKYQGAWNSQKIFSGSMLTMVKIYVDRIETLSVGDSRILIYKNGKLTYKNTPHNRKNPSEMERLKDRIRMKYKKTGAPIPHIVSANELRGFYGEYIEFENGTEIASTQSLGHDDITGYSPEIHTEYFSEDEHIRVISCTDGFSDMILIDGELCENDEDLEDERIDLVTMGLDDLLEKVETRWKKTWTYYWSVKNRERFMLTSYQDGGYDDIGLSVYDSHDFTILADTYRPTILVESSMQPILDDTTLEHDIGLGLIPNVVCVNNNDGDIEIEDPCSTI